MAEKLQPLPCPFCGEDPVSGLATKSRQRWVACAGVNCYPAPRVFASSRKLAIERWNRRPLAKIDQPSAINAQTGRPRPTVRKDPSLGACYVFEFFDPSIVGRHRWRTVSYWKRSWKAAVDHVIRAHGSMALIRRVSDRAVVWKRDAKKPGERRPTVAAPAIAA